MNNPEKLTTKGTQDKVKENKNTTQYEIYYGSLSVTLCVNFLLDIKGKKTT